MSSNTAELPYLTTDLPGLGGELKHVPGDFEVDEIPAYAPSGSGEHLFVWIEKTGVSAEQLTRHVARSLQIAAADVGMAGLKDRQGITRQYVSVPARCAPQLAALETDQIHVLSSELHPHKLRTGHLRGNRFSILLRNVGDEALDRATAIAERLVQLGFPNYYGAQRFGQEDETLQLGWDLLSGKKTPADIPFSRRKLLLRLGLSAAQSALFNQALAERLTDGLLHRVCVGDVLQVVASGGVFVSEDAAADQARFDSREIVPTGPMYGPKMKPPQGEIALREARLLEAAGLRPEEFNRYKKFTMGTRRPYLIWPGDLQVAAEPEGLRFRFSLPAGSYATVLLREFQKQPSGTP
jgi:tRNA pseudouridine13 synthase